MFQNQKFWTLKALECLIKNTDSKKYKLILINNGSNQAISKSIDDFLKEKDIDFEYISYDRSVGVAYAYMEQINLYAKDTESFVILHNDVFVTDGWLDSLLNHSKTIEEQGGVSWSSIFPRTNYCTEGTPTTYDNDLKEQFTSLKLFSKSFLQKEDIENNLGEIYLQYEGLENYAKSVSGSSSGFFKVVQECCSFCTLFNTKIFFEFGGFDIDFLRGRGESKLFNDLAMSNGYYPILALDVFVHHHGNLTTDGPGMNFELDFKESEEIYRKKSKEYFDKKREEDSIRTKFFAGAKALFIREGGIGDLVMSMFVLQAMKKQFPNLSITYMTKPEHMNFVSQFSCVDEVLPISLNYDYSYIEKNTIDNQSRVEELRERFDYVQNWVKYVEFYDKRDVHRIVKFLESIPFENLKPILPEYIFNKKEESKLDYLLSNSNQEKVVVCMDGTCKIRSIPEEVAYKIIDLESKKGKKVFVIGNNREIDLEQFEAKSNIFDLGFDLKLEELPLLLKKVNYVYTPDTGIFHIASMVGTPCKAFFGSINPEFRDGGYYGNKNKIYYKKGILPCVPCRDVGCADVPCMRYTEEEIKRIVDEKC